MSWDNLVKKHWKNMEECVKITNGDKVIDCDTFINICKSTVSNKVQSNEYVLNDTISDVEESLRKKTDKQRLEIMIDIYKKNSEFMEKKKSHSEVFTNINGFEEGLRKAYRKDPSPFLNINSKFLEVSFGTGICLVGILNFLMETLISDAAVMYGTGKEARSMNDSELKKHILDNMLYGCELQDIFAPLALFALDPDQTSTKFAKHLITGDSLEVNDWTFDGDVPNGKFDVVFGNPPYNEIDKDYDYFKEEWADAKETKSLHLAFIRLAVDLLKAKGLIIFITRASVCVNDTAKSFRKNILLNFFDILNIWIPRKGTLFDNAQTTGMLLVARFDPERTVNSETEFARYMNEQDHRCVYQLEKDTDTIPLLWHEHTVDIYKEWGSLKDPLLAQKGIKPDGTIVKKNGNTQTTIDNNGDELEERTNGPKDPNGKNPFLIKLNKNDKETSRTNVDRIRKNVKEDRKTEIKDKKLLCPSGCTDADSNKVQFLENIFEDTAGEWAYSDNIVAIGIPTNHTTGSLRSFLEHPITQIYGSLFRVDRNTSAAFYRRFSYNMDVNKFKDEIKTWAEKQI